MEAPLSYTDEQKRKIKQTLSAARQASDKAAEERAKALQQYGRDSDEYKKAEAKYQELYDKMVKAKVPYDKVIKANKYNIKPTQTPTPKPTLKPVSTITPEEKKRTNELDADSAPVQDAAQKREKALQQYGRNSTEYKTAAQKYEELKLAAAKMEERKLAAAKMDSTVASTESRPTDTAERVAAQPLIVDGSDSESGTAPVDNTNWMNMRVQNSAFRNILASTIWLAVCVASLS